MRHIISLLHLVIITLTAVGGHAESLKIGAVFPVSGSASNLGEGSRLGAEIAVDLINDRGGIAGKKIELILEDSQSEPRVAVTAFHKLINRDRTEIILTALTSVAMAVRPIAEQEKILLFAESTHPNLVQGSQYVLRNFFTADAANKQIFALMKKLKFSKIGVLHAEEEWGEAAYRDLANRAPSEGIEIVGHESFIKSTNDLKSQLLRLKDKKPELFYLIGIGPAVPIAYNQIRDLKLAQEVAGFMICGQPNIMDAAKKSFENTYSVEAALSHDHPNYSELMARLAKKAPGTKLDQQIAVSFDAISMVADALSHVSYSGVNVRDYILRKKTFNGISGRIEFGADGDSKRPMRITRIRDGNCLDLTETQENQAQPVAR